MKRLATALPLIWAIVAIILAATDKNFERVGITLFFRILSLWGVTIWGIKILLKQKFVWSKKDWLIIAMVLIVAIAPRLYLLNSYPFVAVGDELRDGGIDTQKIVNGETKNIFGYGSYESHGLIIPTLVVPFYWIFGNSILTYRLAAAIVGIVDVLLLLLLSKMVLKKYWWWPALIMACLPLHLFYSRTEVVVIWSSLLTTGLLVGMKLFNDSDKKFVNLAMLGTYIGLTFGFHASVRTSALIGLIIILIGIRKKIKSITILLIFVMVGVGPRLLFTTPQIFFKTNEVPVIDKQAKVSGLINSFIEIKDNYKKSVLVYVYETTTSHYGDSKPVFTDLLGVLFILGIGLAIIKKKYFWRVVLVFIFLLPLTNSAITEAVNNDHRLMSAIPGACLLTGMAISWIVNKSNKKSRLLIQIVLGGYLVWQTINFFRLEPANKNKEVSDYVIMNMVYLIKSQSKITPDICIKANQEVIDKLQTIHYQEQLKYFLPRQTFQYTNDENILESNQINLSNQCDENKVYQNKFIKTFKDKREVAIYY